jgi:hypothetical protein
MMREQSALERRACVDGLGVAQAQAAREHGRPLVQTCRPHGMDARPEAPRLISACARVRVRVKDRVKVRLRLELRLRVRGRLRARGRAGLSACARK